MRRPERIKIILDALSNDENKKKVLDFWFPEDEGCKVLEDMLLVWSTFRHDDIFEFWHYNPDLRLSQVLIALNIIPNVQGFWFYIEDEMLMIDTEILDATEIMFWGQNYDKDDNKLKSTNWILIKDMAKDHINAVLNDVMEGKYVIEERYVDAFTKRLKQ